MHWGGRTSTPLKVLQKEEGRHRAYWYGDLEQIKLGPVSSVSLPRAEVFNVKANMLDKKDPWAPIAANQRAARSHCNERQGEAIRWYPRKHQ